MSDKRELTLEEKLSAIDKLKNKSPLEMTKALQEMELYDAKSSQEIIDEVYEQFAGGDNLKDEILKPVFFSVADGLLEGTSFGRDARKKGLTASRLLQECDNFSYDTESNNRTNVNAYIEYKNARHFQQEYAEETRGKYDRKKIENQNAMNKYKQKIVDSTDGKNLTDEYTGEKNITVNGSHDERRNDPKHKYEAKPDHIVPLAEIHKKFAGNYALSDNDIKIIANADYNLALTSDKINGRGDKNRVVNKMDGKGNMTNSEFIKSVEDGNNTVENLSDETKRRMRDLEKSANKEINDKVNETVINNLTGKGIVSSSEKQNAINDFYNKNGRAPTDEEKIKIESNLKKKKTSDIYKQGVKDAAQQAKDYAVGNLILFIIKPIYYELSDSFKNGLQDGVGASSGMEALKIRFSRIKNYVISNAKNFVGDNILDFIKGLISSLIEGIIGLFVGILKQILKIIKEGFKIFTQSAKILFGEQSKSMSAAEKGDAIIKLLGGSIIAIAGIGIESLLNKIGIGEPWSIVLSTMLSGIASALFMYLLDKIDIFSVKAEKRRDRIIEIFEERINDIETVTQSLDKVSTQKLIDQRKEFEKLSSSIQEDIVNGDFDDLNSRLIKMADFMDVDLGYKNEAEFYEYFDKEPINL